MGGGSWGVDTHAAAAAARQAAGLPTFSHTAQINSGRRAAGVHPLLNPTAVAGPDSPFAGQVMREVRISSEHPNPTAMVIGLDVTGSNINAAIATHAKLPLLFGVLQRRGVIEDPQVNCCAIGDAHTDNSPLQVGQFESDNRIDEQLAEMFLEGNGGGQKYETYELLAYYLVRHTYLEPFERSGKKGYVFFIGDEMPYPMIRRNYGRHTLESLTGDQIEADIPTAQIFTELQQRYHVFFLFQAQGHYRERDILPPWRALLGERALVLDDPEAVCEIIAGITAVLEGGLTVDEAVTELLASGADPKAVRAVSGTLAKVGEGSAVANVTGALPDLSDGGQTGSTRL